VTLKERPLLRSRRSCEVNIKMDLALIWFKDVDRICLVQDKNQWKAFVNVAVNFLVP
jgi:hypothetical protein